MKKVLIVLMLLTLAVFFLWYCLWPLFSQYVAADEAEQDAADEQLAPKGPAFSADRAFEFVKKQCEFGPRAMNTEGHERCKEWIVKEFEAAGCQVEQQRVDLVGYDGTTLKATNIIARLNPEQSPRILICAHWDSRPWADNDPDEANWRKPILAANDAASGVAVMLELARIFTRDTLLNKGIDFVCFDAEDWGTPQWSDQPDRSETWALGAQHFASQLPEGAYQWGVLLDMVGGQGAKFYQEAYSQRYAPDVVKRVWRAARRAGYGSYFPKKQGGGVMDDHVPLCRRGIPVADIVPYYPDCKQSGFGPTWHTLEDDLEHIDRNTLKAVGQTLVQLLVE